MQYVDFLRKVPLFAELEEDELEQLDNNVTIFHIEDPANAMFILKNGLVKVTIEDEAGREMILRMLYPTDFFGEMALIDGLPRSATITTQEPTDALVLHRDQFLHMVQQYPKILLSMASVLSRRLRATDELIRSLAFYDVYGKVARVLLNLAAEKGRATEGETVIDLRLTRMALS